MASTLATVAVLGATGCHLAGTAAMGVVQGYCTAGDLSREYANRTHAVTRVGCVDVGTSLRPSASAQGQLVLDLRIGNGCGDAVTVDVSQLRVVAVHADGPRMPASLVDPKDELHPRRMGGRVVAFEPVLVRGVADADEVCLDVADMAPHEGPEVVPLCFTRRDDGWPVTPGRRP